MTYDTPQALRMALEQRLLTQSQESGIALDRLRRRVVFQRIVTRLQRAEPGPWVLKGGMALEVRLGDNPRLTKEIDLMLLHEHELLHASALAQDVAAVWAERDGAAPPAQLPTLPAGWPSRYERLAAEHDVEPPLFPAAAALAAELWAQMFNPKES